MFQIIPFAFSLNRWILLGSMFIAIIFADVRSHHILTPMIRILNSQNSLDSAPPFFVGVLPRIGSLYTPLCCSELTCCLVNGPWYPRIAQNRTLRSIQGNPDDLLLVIKLLLWIKSGCTCLHAYQEPRYTWYGLALNITPRCYYRNK